MATLYRSFQPIQQGWLDLSSCCARSRAAATDQGVQMLYHIRVPDSDMACHPCGSSAIMKAVNTVIKEYLYLKKLTCFERFDDSAKALKT